MTYYTAVGNALCSILSNTLQITLWYALWQH